MTLSSTQPVQTRAVQTRAVQTQPVPTQPVQTQAVQTQPGQTQAVPAGLAPVRPLALPPRRTWRTTDSLDRPEPYTQGALALSYPIPLEPEAVERVGAERVGAEAGALEAAAVEARRDRRTGPLIVVPHGSAGCGEGVEAWAATFIQAIVEVIASERPVTQLVRWTSRPVYQEISGRQRLVAKHREGRATRAIRRHVATVRICRPTDGSAEVAARVVFGSRSRAIAARLDFLRGRWLCTDISFG